MRIVVLFLPVSALFSEQFRSSHPDLKGRYIMKDKLSSAAGLSVLLFFVMFFASPYSHAVVVEGRQTGLHKKNANMKSASRFREGEILVKFKSLISEDAVQKLHRKHGSGTIKEFRSLNVHHVKLPKGMSVEDAIQQYKAEPEVEYAEPNFLVSVQNMPSDPFFVWQDYLYNMGQLGGTPRADIHVSEAWDITTGDGTVAIAVLDMGADYNHPDLTANIWRNDAEYFGLPGVDDDGNGYIDDIHGIDTFNHDGDPQDDALVYPIMGHGTHVAGIIGAAGNNDAGITGVNWSVKIIPCKFIGVDGYGYDSGAIECLEYVHALKQRGVNIAATNNSWGCSGADCYSQALYDAINAQRDILFISSAGNDGNDISPCYPTATLVDTTPAYPASYDLPNVIAVSATDNMDQIAGFSNYGKHSVHVGAPGLDIFSTLPLNQYGVKSGTSMAAPQVSGLAALLKAQDPDRDWIKIKNLILTGGDTTQPHVWFDGPFGLQGITITGKRINAYGSMTCSNSPVFSALKIPSFQIGEASPISALSINCDTPVGPVTASTSEGEFRDLRDDGIAPDLVAGDGIFTGTWNPAVITSSMTFSSPAGTDTVKYTPVIVTDRFLPSGSAGVPYSATLQATGGIPPYTWSLVGNRPDCGTPNPACYDLPHGLTLNSATGEISGIPLVNENRAFYVQVTGANSATVMKYFSIYVEGPLPDLMVSSLSFPSSSPTAAQITAAVTVKNIGPGNAGKFTVGLYLYQDSTLTTYAINFGDASINYLASGAEFTVNMSGAIGKNLASGNYFMGAVANNYRSFDETNENNNKLASQISITQIPVVASFTQNNNQNAWTMGFTDTSSGPQGDPITIFVNWGDGSSMASGPQGSVFTHTYTNASTYTIYYKATDADGLLSDTKKLSVTMSKFQITGKVTKSNGTDTISSVNVVLKNETGGTVKSVYTDSYGNYTMSSLYPGNYTIELSKNGYTFNPIAVTVGPNQSINVSAVSP